MYQDIAGTVIARTGIIGGRLLDLGCGPGHFGLAVGLLGDYQTWFCDLAPDALEFARQNVTQPATYVCANAAQLPFADASFDLIISRGSQPFWDDQLRCFAEIRRVLTPRGRAYLGGGRGSVDFQARRRAAEPAAEFDGPPRDASKALPTETYRRALTAWGCEVQIFEAGEGRWFCFDRGAG